MSSVTALSPRRMSLVALLGSLLVGFLILGLIVGAVLTRQAVSEIERAHPMTGRLAGLPDAPLHVVERGDLKAPPERTAVLIHGATSTLDVALAPLAPLFPADWRVIALERPGHGWSPRAPEAKGAIGEASDPSEQGRRIIGALAELGVPSAHVFGHSLGGMTALTLALDHPGKVRSLTLLSPVSHPWPGGIAWHYRLTNLPLVGPLFSETIALPAARKVLPGGLASAFKPQPVPDGYVVSRRIELALRPANFRANAADVSALLGHVERRHSRWSELNMPVHIIAGDVDTTVSTEIHSRALVQQVKGATLIVRPNGGHNLQERDAELIVKQMTNK
jgi:pimeloyl-ACP methyl ester carboxylesterase